MNYPSKRPQGQGRSGGSNYSNNSGGGGGQRRQRFSGGGGGGQSNNGGGNRPRKNYGAMREKYLTQARDALSMGDRVLAENYFQHADHCFRMMAEEAASRPQRQPQQQNRNQNQESQEQAAESSAENSETAAENTEPAGELDDSISLNVSSLPAFLTANYEPPKVEGTPAPAQNWEEE